MKFSLFETKTYTIFFLLSNSYYPIPTPTHYFFDVHFRCNMQANCSVAVNDQQFGEDPCPGTFKYVEVHYECVGQSPRHFFACELGTLLDSGDSRAADQEISMIRAIWGAQVGHRPKLDPDGCRKKYQAPRPSEWKKLFGELLLLPERRVRRAAPSSSSGQN
jgi:Galactose binding lectin domain